ncbi:hypothetical protein ABT369_38695 [Dactylosporangium sp. NPDC000244]|uniref:hypothetical protein n=1 Tax=Dactylosporangium sp. NPDC000244 TaxID=3154365 RepID=UPI00331BE148
MTSRAVEILREVRERRRINNRRVRGCTCPPDTPEGGYAAGCRPHEDFAVELHRMVADLLSCGCPRSLTDWRHACGHVTCEQHRSEHDCGELTHA